MPRTRSLPILDNLDDIRIASPCDASWDAMKPLTDADGACARFCGSCEKNVYDLSSMTRVEALSLIERHEGQCCVRFYKRHDGTVLTEDCPVGVEAMMRKARLKAMAGIASCAGAAAAVVAFLLGTANPVSRALNGFETRHAPVAGGISMPVEMGEMPAEPFMGDVVDPRKNQPVEPVVELEEPAPLVETPRPKMGQMVKPVTKGHPEKRPMMGGLAPSRD